MDDREKERFLCIRMKGKTGRGDITPEEMEFLSTCRKDFPGACSELEEEIQHRVMESLSPFYVRVRGSR